MKIYMVRVYGDGSNIKVLSDLERSGSTERILVGETVIDDRFVDRALELRDAMREMQPGDHYAVVLAADEETPR